MDCRPPIEPCHVEECDGFDEVVALLPPGQLWQLDRDSVYTRYIRALGHIKTEWNKRICQEWGEGNPCTAIRLQRYWADFYSFPDCVELTGDALCDWVRLVLDPNCPPGTLGFLQRAIDFVFPERPPEVEERSVTTTGTSGVSVTVNYPDIFGNSASPSVRCADQNAIVITAPPEYYRYEVIENAAIEDYFDPQDGVDGCRRYFIPEIDCLRKCVFPLGLSVGYKTDPTGPNGEDIYGVPATALEARTPPFIICEDRCDG